MVGKNDVVVWNFIIIIVVMLLVNVKFEDLGMYFYIIEY